MIFVRVEAGTSVGPEMIAEELSVFATLARVTAACDLDGSGVEMVASPGQTPTAVFSRWDEARRSLNAQARPAKQLRRPMCSLCQKVDAVCSGPLLPTGPARLFCAACCSLAHVAGTCVPLGEDAREIPSRPTFNHTRGDGALSPCPECAVLMSPSELARAYRRALVDLLDMSQGDDTTHRCKADGQAPCCIAERLLKATAVDHGQGAGVPPAVAVAPTGPGGGTATENAGQHPTSAGPPVDLCRHSATTGMGLAVNGAGAIWMCDHCGGLGVTLFAQPTRPTAVPETPDAAEGGT